MARKASDGIQQLIDRTSGAKVTATVTMDQLYAEAQHEHLEYRHPRGGQAKFLEAPLFANFPKYLQGFADRLLNARKNVPSLIADEFGRPLARDAAKAAPVEFGDLRNSAGLKVKEGTSTVVNEPPKQPRLTDEELRAKDYMRDMGVGYR